MHPVLLQIESLLTPTLIDLDADQTQLRPETGSPQWSVQQIIEHLILTYGLTGQSFGLRLEKGTPTQASVSLKQRAMQALVISLGVFPAGRPAPLLVVPHEPITPLRGDALVAVIHAELCSLDQIFEQAESKFGRCRAVTHQILGPLNVRQWRTFHLMHARHHLKQIQRIRRKHAIGLARS